MSALFQDVGGFPSGVREPVRESILGYDRSVLERRLPRRRAHRRAERRHQPEAQRPVLPRCKSAEPVVGTSAFYAQAVNDVSEVTKARRSRNADAEDTIPGPLFFLVVVISFAVLGVATLLNTRERGTHVALLAVLAIVTALNLALIVALEHPFCGSIAVGDQPLHVGVLAPAAR